MRCAICWLACWQACWIDCWTTCASGCCWPICWPNCCWGWVPVMTDMCAPFDGTMGGEVDIGDLCDFVGKLRRPEAKLAPSRPQSDNPLGGGGTGAVRRRGRHALHQAAQGLGPPGDGVPP